MALHVSVALLMLRTGTTGLLWTFHAWHKLVDFELEARAFPDPIGIGHESSLLVALGVESVCGLLVAAGLFSRLACLPIIAIMLVVLALAASGTAGTDIQAALHYALVYGALALTGPGAFALDKWRAGKRSNAKVVAALATHGQ